MNVAQELVIDAYPEARPMHVLGEGSVYIYADGEYLGRGHDERTAWRVALWNIEARRRQQAG
jgi:hypothetical protein